MAGSISASQVCFYINNTCVDYSGMTTHLSSNAYIVHNSIFEQELRKFKVSGSKVYL